MSDSPNISISPCMAEYFEGVVADAVEVRNVEATPAAKSYLVGLLVDFAHPDEEAESTFTQPLTFLLRDAMGANGPERFRRLRTLGDGVLYGAGFFGGHIALRGVDRSYVLHVGSTAYDQASAMLRLTRGGAGPDVLGELAARFERFVEVLADVADGTIARGARDQRAVVKLYERWLRTGSARLADELGARGIVPTRGAGGLN